MTNPFLAINANGDAVTRGVTLALPTDTVRVLLPAGLEPGVQNVTPDGTHPVLLFFHDFSGAGFSVPSPFPRQTYREFSLGVPYTYLTAASITPGHPGPWYFVPKLYLDNPFPVVTGLLGWGFAKRMASIHVTPGLYEIADFAHHKLTSLAWNTEAAGDYRAAAAWPNFVPIRAMLQQPVISLVPAAIGPYFVASNFDRNWEVATIKPMHTAVEVENEFVPGYPAGRYPAAGWSPGIDESVLGSYELRAPWRLSMPYSPMLSFR